MQIGIVNKESMKKKFRNLHCLLFAKSRFLLRLHSLARGARLAPAECLQSKHASQKLAVQLLCSRASARSRSQETRLLAQISHVLQGTDVGSELLAILQLFQQKDSQKILRSNAFNTNFKLK